MASEQPPSETEVKQEGEESADLTQFVEKLLGDMQQKFQLMSEQIIGRLDEMGKRVDELEKNISDLMHQVESRDVSSNK